ncbi:MAG: D-alanine--D-alanine ligase family protein [Marmoricola sp.]
MTTRIAVIGGGQNCEHEVSLASAAGIADALDASRYRAVRLTIDRDGRWHDEYGTQLGLAAAITVLQSCAAAIPALHGPRGEDGTVAALLDLAGVPYVGSGVRAGALAMDKHATKLLAGSVGVATAPGVLLTDPAAYRWTHPVVVKPVAAGSSQGVALVATAAELAPALDAAFALDDRVLVEDVVLGREIDLAVLARPDGARVVAPALEIVVDGLFDAGTKYDGSADFRIPASLAESELAALESAAVAVFDALGCRGVARVDFFWTTDGPVLNEVNTMPGFTAASQVPKMFAAAGVSYADLLDLLVTDARTASSSVVPLPA